MNYYIVSGSPRLNSQSTKIANYMAAALRLTDKKATIHILDLAKNRLPFWEESFIEKNEDWNESWNHISHDLKNSDALIVVVPEWDGMVPACVKNFFQLCNKEEIAHKPGLIVSVSASMNGVYPVAELRMNSYKNNKICYMPDHLIIRNANQVLNDNAISHNNEDQFIRERIKYTLAVLKIYARNFIKIRKHKTIQYTKFKYGM